MAAFLTELRHRSANSLRERNFNFDSRTNNLAISLLVQPTSLSPSVSISGPSRGTRLRLTSLIMNLFHYIQGLALIVPAIYTDTGPTLAQPRSRTPVTYPVEYL